MGLFDRLFRRKPTYKPSTGDGLTHGQWAVGDLAVCVGKGAWLEWSSGAESKGPVHGSVHRVAGVFFREGYHCLQFARWPDDGYTASAFRKAVLDQSGERETEIAKLITRAGKKVRA